MNFECKVKYTKIDEKSGKEKTVTESYLVDAVSFTEAEARIYEKMKLFIHCEFIITDIRRANYTDIFITEECDKWYKCKVSFMSVDESAMKEKKVTNLMLVTAISVEDADQNLKNGLNGMTVDFDIVSISERPILDYFPYN